LHDEALRSFRFVVPRVDDGDEATFADLFKEGAGVCPCHHSPGACDRVDSAIRAAQVQLPDAQRQHGFAGFYLLADREAGKLLTLSLWDSYDDVLAAEAHAAQLRSQTARSLAVAAPAVDVYEVAVQA